MRWLAHDVAAKRSLSPPLRGEGRVRGSGILRNPLRGGARERPGAREVVTAVRHLPKCS